MLFVMSDKMPKTREDLNALPERERIMFTQYAQQMEALGIQVAQRLIDMELVDKTLGSFVTLTWKRYANVYLTMRDRDPFVAEYFQWMAERMDEKTIHASPITKRLTLNSPSSLYPPSYTLTKF
jgi:hypothetical protein